MEVKLISYTKNPDRVCASAAFTSWKKLSTKELFEELTDREVDDFLRKVIGFGHLSVTEHASFTFSVSGISRACSHQLVRHRIASYTQQSQRYVKFKKNELEFITPRTIERNKSLYEEYKSIMEKISEFYEKLLKENIPAEDARYVIPNAATTNLTVTMNARELLHFFGLRLCERAQWEIRELAKMMLDEVKKVAPILFESAGPRCEKLGYCPEGELSCGRYPPKEKIIKQ
ncbi:MAG: FAD-dependent thymidylate synthase [Candidatus Altiarchaeales archaeon]|nr:MAG: FAD-dependent thymidylate synthase [Candidatus Altiarchaeales archaeon]HDO82135.1 FAD-dependent thymidylate synthase [Candidatus Altiarchaeales archaeon]HEX54784.1 FAD-dependent thymidylate synthase [Candidatus Altiarchaeales archaeon]